MTERSALRDERGAILMLGVVFAVFMTGVLFYLTSISETLVLVDRIQDAVDRGVFGAAVVHARGMNLLVLLNQTMSALLAVLVGLRLTETLAALGMAVAAGLSFVPGVAGVVPPLAAVQRSAHRAYETLNEPVHGALKAIHVAELAVKDVMPALAVAAYTTDGHGSSSDGTSPVGVGIAPARLTLPVESDDFGVLCEHAGRDAASVALAPFSRVGLPDAIRDPLRDAVGDLVHEESDWFCGKPGAKEPEVKRTIERVLPVLADREACEGSGKKSSAGTSAACDEVDREESQSAPDAMGACSEACGQDGPYEERIQKAREQCDPRSRTGLHGFHWSERTVRARLGHLAVHQRVHESPVRIVEQQKASYIVPCGTPTALYGEGYALRVREPGQREVTPLCVGPMKPVEGSGTLVEFVEVLNVFQCILTETRRFDVGKGPRAGNAEDESPVRIEKGLAATSDDFQLRGVGGVPVGETAASRVVGVSAYARPVEDAPRLLRGAGGTALAEAEYGFDGEAPPVDWMWERSFTAHLSRYRAPEASRVIAELSIACGAVLTERERCAAVALAAGPLALEVAH